MERLGNDDRSEVIAIICVQRFVLREYKDALDSSLTSETFQIIHMSDVYLIPGFLRVDEAF